jgi:hypothetical protein
VSEESDRMMDLLQELANEMKELAEEKNKSDK